MAIPQFLDRIAKERNCAPELVLAIVGDALGKLHEASFKGGVGTALLAAYWELGDQSAWHFCGLLSDATGCEAGELWEHYKRLDPSLSRFSTIARQLEAGAGA